MADKKASGISVYVANLGKYVEGWDVGDWITLPVPQAELDRFLRDAVGLELDPETAFEKGMRGEPVYEEYEIHDYDFDKGLAAIGYRPGPYTNLDDLNILAATLENLSEYELEALRLCFEQDCSLDEPLELANLALQADEIPYFAYSIQGTGNAVSLSAESKIGYTLLEGSSAMEELERLGLSDYFDVEKYGRDHGYNCVTGDHGWLDCTMDLPDSDFYDREEIKELIEHRHEGFFKPLSEVEKEQAHGQDPPSLSDRKAGVQGSREQASDQEPGIGASCHDGDAR